MPLTHDRNGIGGGLNWYRNLNTLPTVLAPFTGAVIRQQDSMPNLHALQVFPGAGHWLQQERPDGVNAALLDFLRAL